MATVKQVLLSDDLGGKDQDVQTVTLGFNGEMVELDLNSLNRANLNKSLAKYIAAGRPVTRKSASNGKSTDKSAVREWARENGFEVGERGRIRADVQDAYQAAQSTASVTV